jgi:hypothetical protein
LQKIILNCVENKKDFFNITLLDYVLFITKLRIISIGSDFELYFKQTDKKDPEKVTLDLNVFMKTLYESAVESLRESFLVEKNIKIKLDYPNITSECFLLDSKGKNSIEHILSSVSEYIQTIEIEGKTIKMLSFTTEEKNEMYERLPVSLRSKIQLKVLSFIKTLSNKNLFGLPNMDIFKFNFYNKSHQELIRFFFSNDLRSIYQVYYILASKKISPSFVDSLSIPERRVFISFVEEEMKSRAQNVFSSEISGGGNSTQLQDLMDEFGG